MSDALRNLVTFVQFKKRENTQQGVLLSVKLQASPEISRKPTVVTSLKYITYINFNETLQFESDVLLIYQINALQFIR